MPIIHPLGHHNNPLFPTDAQRTIAEHLTHKNHFETASLWHEYFLLLKEHFRDLSETAQGIILSWIESGPNFAKLRSDVFPNEAERQSYRQAWQLRHLIPIKEDLPPKWKEYYRQLLEQLQEPEHPEYLYWVSEARWGWSSPKKADQLETLSVSELISFLRTWEPAQDQFYSTPEGLAQELKKVVTSDPERFITELEKFQGVDPTYIRALLSAFHECIKQKRSIDYGPILDLCEWVVIQPKEISGRKIHSVDQDPNWGWTRSEITRLLEAGLEPGESEIPFQLRMKGWKVVEVLCKDPEPTVEEEEKYSGSNMDSSTLSLNTVRGQAMHLVICYAVWTRRHLVTAVSENEAPSFDHMPEVREVLEDHLEPTRDASPAVRSVYGQWLPTLAFLDKFWVEHYRERIFPKDAALTHLREAAWDSFITFSFPSWGLYELLKEDYQYAISQIGAARETGSHLGDPRVHLVGHLMFLYWTGKLGLDGDGLLDQFFQDASPELRGHAIDFVGNSLCHTEEPVPAEVLGRLKCLFESRYDQAKRSEQIEPFEKELAAYGWWFASGKFDVQWSLLYLKNVLELRGNVESEHLVLEQLASMATELSEPVVECLEKIVESDKKGWRLPVWTESIRKILATALRASDEASKRARHLINKLAARGYLEYRELLPE